MSLTDAACRAAKSGPALRKLTDGAGLQLWVQPNGSRLWRFAFRFAGKQKLLALGSYPEVSLADARAARDKAKGLLADGIDPCRAKQLAKVTAEANANSFEIVGKEYVDKLKREGRAKATIKKLEWLLGLAYPEIGYRPIGQLKPIELLAVLRGVEKRGRYETARRLRSTISAVFRYAVATARAESDPTAVLAGALTTPKTSPRPAITEPGKVAALLRAIDGFDGHATTVAALKLMALLFPRPGELRAAEWQEFDLQAAVWTIPASRAKMRRPHAVPLSTQAVAIVSELKEITGKHNYVFPAIHTWRRCMSENTLNGALRRLGYAKHEMTAHGFRATASTLLNESGKWHRDAIERQLAHVEANDVRRAYARGEYWDQRVEMMQWWADYLDQLKAGGKLLPFCAQPDPKPRRTGRVRSAGRSSIV